VQLASLRAAAASRQGATASTSATPAPAWLSLREASEREALEMEALEDTDMEDIAPHELEGWGSMQASATGAHVRATATASGKSGSTRVSFLVTV
jgi:hypothetical protein